MTAPGRVVVVGVGNPWRCDDGAGPAVAAAVRDRRPRRGPVEVVELDGEAARLLDAWDGTDLAVVVDAVRTGAPPGTVHRLDAEHLDAGEIGAAGTASSHALGVEHAVALGRSLGRLPARLVLVAVEGAAFGFGRRLSPAVAAAVQPAARLVTEVIEGSA